MKTFVGITDGDWFEYLAALQPEEVNFWKPGGSGTFQVLKPGEPFLFKLHAPNNFIVGGGFFVSFSQLPLSLSWEAFGPKNGVSSFRQFRERIAKYRKVLLENLEPDPYIGCVILSNPFFFPKHLWVPVPPAWPMNVVQGKSYDIRHGEGAAVWSQVMAALGATEDANAQATSELPIVAESASRYGSEYLTRGRLGQGAFRVLVTDAYTRRCAITGEKTLPVLEAAHIKPYEQSGPHQTPNGLLLRADLHKLFDRGLITVTPEHHVEVSSRIKEEWENGREYYKYHGKELAILPQPADRPASTFLQWHNENCFRG